MKKLTTFIGCCLLGLSAQAQDFNEYFENKTLRTDYLFAGDVNKQEIFLDELSSIPAWSGRRHHLDELPVAGNGQITMRDKESGKVIYRTSFSSLFREWIGEKEAQHTQKGYENSFLLPFPKNNALISVELRNARHEVTAQFTHEVDPTDILIHQRGINEITPHKYIHQAGSSVDCIDIAILAEGYTKDQMDIFYKDAEIACESLFNHEPFKKYKDRFNIVAVASPSKDTGVSIPKDGKWKETAVSSHFSTFYMDRYLTTCRVKQIHNWLAGIPYEHIIILANTEEYGGGGIYNSYMLTTAHHKDFRPVVVHEFGHSFGGLADEYAYIDAPNPNYPLDVEPWEPNITTLVHFEDKWKDMIPNGTPIPTPYKTKGDEIFRAVGVYEGGGYCKRNIYRPTTECRMKINEAPGFCPVCERALERMIKFYTEK